MTQQKEKFLDRRILLNCITFSAPISLLFVWRFTHVRGIPFFSADTGVIYLVFVVVDFLIFLLVFYILYWLSKRQQMD